MFSIKLSKIAKGIRFRLTLVYSTLFGLFLCVFAYIMTTQYFQSGRDDFDSGLLNYAIDISEFLEIDDKDSSIHFKIPESEDKKAFPFLLAQTYYVVRSLDGNILGKSVDTFPFEKIPFDANLPLKKNYTHRFVTFKYESITYRAVNLKFANTLGEEMFLQVAGPLTSVLEREENHLLMTALMVPLLIIISSFFSFLISGNALSPIKTLTDSANNIAVKNLSLRVPNLHTGDEVEELANTLNNLLERLEKAFKGQEHFVANASHQLNTPLAIIKGELDVLESKNRSLEDHQLFNKSLREEIERLIELVKNMLLISRVESGLEKFDFNSIRLDDLLLTTTSRLRAKAREKRITIRFNIEEELEPLGLEVMGERQLLDSLFENILDNAIKYSPINSTVELNIKMVEGCTEVWIKDEGPGIQGEFEKVLNSRYLRETPHTASGTGIGLPIANKIAQFHHAQISYRKLTPQGSLFIVQFCGIKN